MRHDQRIRLERERIARPAAYHSLFWPRSVPALVTEESGVPGSGAIPTAAKASRMAAATDPATSILLVACATVLVLTIAAGPASRSS